MHLGCKNWVSGPRQTLFGDGTYSGNIIQGGAVLQPQTVNWPPDQNTGGSAGSTNNNYTRVDISWSFPAGETVTHLGIYGTGAAFTALLYIMRRNSAGNYTNVASITATVAATAGWQFFPLPTAFAVPADAYTYHVGSYSASNMRNNNVTTLRASYVGQFVVGTTATMGEGSDIMFMVAARYEQRALANCIYITGAATVAPDPTTGAAGFSCENIVIVGASASLTASTNCKGLIGFASGKSYFINGATMSMSGKGVYSATHPDTPIFDLIPAAISRKLKSAYWKSLVLQGAGVSGGAARTTGGVGNTGSAGGSWQSGGGGSGGVTNSGTSGKGGCGGPFSGGSGGGGITNSGTVTVGTNGKDAQDYGGFGGDGFTDPGDYHGGGAGNPGGKGGTGSTPNASYDGQTGTGGVLILASPSISIASGCIIQADGKNGGTTPHNGGGGSGGGIIGIIHGGSYTNNGTVRANGGSGGTGSSGGGGGGAGSVNIAKAE